MLFFAKVRAVAFLDEYSLIYNIRGWVGNGWVRYGEMVEGLCVLFSYCAHLFPLFAHLYTFTHVLTNSFNHSSIYLFTHTLSLSFNHSFMYSHKGMVQT